MLTALVHAGSSPGALAATLSSLVPAVAEGLISHAVVTLPGSDADAERIADAMGATVITSTADHWREAARAAKGDWVLLLVAGETPGHGWIGAIERHLLQQSSARQRPALLPVAGLIAGWRERSALLVSAKRPRAGLIAPRQAIAAGSSGGVPLRLSVRRERVPL